MVCAWLLYQYRYVMQYSLSTTPEVTGIFFHRINSFSARYFVYQKALFLKDFVFQALILWCTVHFAMVKRHLCDRFNTASVLRLVSEVVSPLYNLQMMRYAKLVYFVVVWAGVCGWKGPWHVFVLHMDYDSVFWDVPFRENLCNLCWICNVVDQEIAFHWSGGTVKFHV